MDVETPVDAWHVWLGVAVVSVALTGFVVGLPTQPPPDATKAVNTVDRVAGSSHDAAATYEHDASEVKIGLRRVVMRNDGGTTRDSVAFETVVPVDQVRDEAARRALERIARGEGVRRVLATTSVEPSGLTLAVNRTRERLAEAGPEWMPSDGSLAVRQVEVDGVSRVLVSV